MNKDTNFNLMKEDDFNIDVSVSNPTQIKSTLSSFTVYQLKGIDLNGEFSCTRRYSQFDLVRNALLTKWPGCFIPSLPEKKTIGHTEAWFTELRAKGLELFCIQMANLKHLWYSEEFQLFLRVNSEAVKGIKPETPQDIVKKYEEKLFYLKNRTIDSETLSKVLIFYDYLKKTQPILSTLKETVQSFIEIKNTNYENYSTLFNYILPQYEKICLTTYLNGNTEGKHIFNDETDERLNSLLNQLKQVIAKKNFNQLLSYIENYQRQINGFLQIYKIKANYEKKLEQERDKKRNLQIQKQKLNEGKQKFFKSLFKSNIEENKKENEKQILVNNQQSSALILLLDYIVIILGYFEIDRFKTNKLKRYKQLIHEISQIQIIFCKTQKQLCTHVLDNYNLI